MRIIALINLKPGISREDYETWARTVDLPTVNALPSIDAFTVFRTTGVLGSDAQPPFSHFEILEVNDMEQFGQDVQTETMQIIAATFMNMADVTFMTAENIVA